jgi:hypothetical protein
MALISCPECSREISDQVKNCPHCGFPLKEEVEQKTQKVEIASVNLQTKNPQKIKKIVVSVALLLVVLVAAFFIQSNLAAKNLEAQLKEDKNTYINNIEKASLLMIAGGTHAEKLMNLTGKVWYNSIYKQSDAETNQFTIESYYYKPSKNEYEAYEFLDDFNDALGNLFSHDSTQKTIEAITTSQESLLELAKAMQNPPEGFERVFDTFSNMYTAYISMSDYAINPTGNLTSFGQEKTKRIDRFLELYKMMQTQIPEKVE